MKTENKYVSPKIQVVQMNTEQMLLITSITGEGIYEWEDM